MKKTPSGKSKPPKDKNKEKNKDKFIRLRVTTEAFNRVSARAKEAGYTLGAYARMRLDEEDDGFRARRRPITEVENVTTLLGSLGSIRALHNQMAHQANIHGFDPMAFDEAQEAALDYRDFLYRQMGRDAPPAKAVGPRPPRRMLRQELDGPTKVPPGSVPPDSKFTGGSRTA